MYLTLQLGSSDFLERQFSAEQFWKLYHRRHKTQIPIEIMILHRAAREFLSAVMSYFS